MDTKLMAETARAMVAPGKGLLAADESAGTCKKRFDSALARFAKQLKGS